MKEGVWLPVPERVPEMVDTPVMEEVMVCDPVRVLLGLTDPVPVPDPDTVPVLVLDGV